MKLLIPSLALVLGLSIVSTEAATLISTHDTFVRRGDTNGSGDNTTNFNDQNLRVKFSADNSNANRISFIRFDISTIGFTATSSTLTLTAVDGTMADRIIRVYGIPTTNADRLFSETTLTFNNSASTVFDDTSAPRNNINPSVLTDLGTFNALNDLTLGKINFSTAALNTYINTLRTGSFNDASFVLVMETANTVGNPAFEDREGGASVAPTLTVIPEPSSLALLFAAGVTLIATRRRRR